MASLFCMLPILIVGFKRLHS